MSRSVVWVAGALILVGVLGAGYAVFTATNDPMSTRRVALNEQLSQQAERVQSDATASGDRIAAEGYFQHAEHYYRVFTGLQEANQARQAQTNGGSRHEDRGSGGNGEDRKETVPQVAPEPHEAREAELSETDVARSEPN